LQQGYHIIFVEVHEQTTEEDELVVAIGFKQQDITVYCTDVGIQGTSLLQHLVERTAAFDGDHSREAASKLLGPIPNTTSEIENRAIVLYATKQVPYDLGFCLKTKIACTHRKTEAIHHVRPEDRGLGILPILVD
jgi:hypothetical protein